MACISIPTAMLISGGLSAGGSLVSGVMGANAATQAANIQSEATDKASAQTLQMYNMNKEMMSPFIDAGKTGMSGVINLLGAGQMDPAAIQSFLAKTPGYQFMLEQGLQGVQNSYAAKGLASSGAALKGASEYTTGLAGTHFQELFGNFLDTARLGEGAGAAVAGMGAQSQQQINDLITGGATARASGVVGSTNAMMAGLTGATNAIGQNIMLSGLYGGGMLGVPPAAPKMNNLIPNWNPTTGSWT